MPRRQALTWSPQFVSASSARAQSASNLGISGDSSFSLFAYFYINTIGSTQYILTIGSGSGAHAGVHIRATSATEVDVNIFGIGSVPVSSLPSLVNRWASVCVTKQAGSNPYLIYVDGTPRNGGGTASGAFVNSPLYIGSDQTPTAAFNGNISCIGAWTTALSAAQVLQLHNCPSTPVGSPVVFYTATEGTGTTLRDSSGNANNATLTSVIWDGGQVPLGYRAPLEINSPNDLISPMFYFDSRYGVTDDGSGKASAWLDQSPKGISATQSTSASRPAIISSAINGLQGLRITAAADEYMTATTDFIGGSKEHSLFCVIRGTNTGPSAFVGFLALGSGAVSGQTSSIGIDNTNKFWFGGSGDGIPALSDTIAASTTYALGKGSNSRYVDVYLNGIHRLDSSPVLATSAISPATTLLIGQYTAGSVGADYYIGALCGWNRRLGHREWRALNNWAYRVWGAGTSVVRSAPSFRVFISNAPIRNAGFDYQPAFTAASNTQATWIDGTAAGTTTDPGYGWAVLEKTGTAAAQFDTSTAAVGSGSMKLSTLATGSLITVSNIRLTTDPSQACPASGSTAYTCTFRMKTNVTSGDSNNGASIAFVERNAAGTLLASNTSTEVKTTTDWTLYTVSFTSNASTVWIAPRLQCTGSTGAGTLIMDAWFDDIKISASTIYNRSAVS